MSKTGKKKTWKKVLICVVILLMIAGGAAYFFIRNMFSQATIKDAKPSDQAVVHTTHGDLRGSLDHGVYQFLGVQYADAKERFTLAEEIEDWEGIKDATQVGPMSPQSAMLGMGGGSDKGTDNSSQNMNIWTTGIKDDKKRPVMVWLHGGGFSSGTANTENYDGRKLSAFGDVVVVGVNHRLGTAGFLDLSAYDEKYRYSGNAGLDDIVKALEWIQKNIEEFGGDPGNVTVFGQSGGGAKVLALMTTPKAKGLFQKGIVQSGATETLGVTFSSSEVSQTLTKKVLENLKIAENDIEKLQKIDMSEIEDATANALQETAREYEIPAPLTDTFAMEWGPVVDGDYLPSNPVTEESFAENGKDITLLIGSNLNEWAFMGQSRKNVSEEVEKAFVNAYPDKKKGDAKRVDTLIRLPMLKIMSHKADQKGAEVYAYVFTHGGPGGAYHGAEIPYVFHHENGKLGDQMAELWINFARNGVPSADGVPEWEPYTREKEATMILDDTSVLRYGHDRDLMNLLKPDYEY